MPIFELRQYRIRPGQMDDWVKFAEEHIIPFQTDQGMTIVGSWVGEEDDGLFVWIRRFDSEAERERLYKAVYESDHWKTDVAPHIPAMMIREELKVTRMLPTPRSHMP